MNTIGRAVKQLVKSCLSRRQLGGLERIRVRLEFCGRYGFRYFRLSAFKSVQGFLMDEEGFQLFSLAKSLPDPGVVVEIGSWMGKSSTVLGRALLSKKQGRLFCIDTFNEASHPRLEARYHAEVPKMKTQMSLREAFESSIRRNGLAKIVDILEGPSHEFAVDWHEPIDMLFIDGDHSFDSVKQDFFDWARFVKPRGLVAFHDTWFSPPTPDMKEYTTGPGEVVSTYVLPDSTWERVCHVHSLFVARKVGVGSFAPRRNDL